MRRHRGRFVVTPFEVAGVPLTADAALVELGLDVPLGPSAALALGYSGLIAGGGSAHALRGQVAYRF